MDDAGELLSSVVFNAVSQIQSLFEKSGMSQAELAEKLGVTEGRISQILNADRSMTLKQMVRVARVMGLKASVVIYDDGDHEGKHGPLHPSIFEACWVKCGSPVRMGQISSAMAFTNEMIPDNVVLFEGHTASTSGKDKTYA
jgi:predicted XRE-type DNA-binding protein